MPQGLSRPRRAHEVWPPIPLKVRTLHTTLAVWLRVVSGRRACGGWGTVSVGARSYLAHLGLPAPSCRSRRGTQPHSVAQGPGHRPVNAGPSPRPSKEGLLHGLPPASGQTSSID